MPARLFVLPISETQQNYADDLTADLARQLAGAVQVIRLEPQPGGDGTLTGDRMPIDNKNPLEAADQIITYLYSQDDRGDDDTYTDEEQAEVQKRLEDLGYL